MNTLAFMGMPGGSEVILILFIILLLFGAKKLPELSRSLGKSLGEFKKGKEDLEREMRDVQNSVHKEMTKPEPAPEEKKKQEPVATEPSPEEKSDEDDASKNPESAG
jgi:sec-independent protein translocase protein TatA